ncbi:MAG: NGG1p interacting factor NIF3 [Sulfuricurvum sp.]|uniref:NGG1p interacting factor NIF3 n=1 Tax=Sulfuricurvum sp. TaxID=2025608 RepID=UPI003D13D577
MLYQVIVYVPLSHADSVKNALFDAGAGHYEHYDRCSWETSGTGQFRPLEGSKPTIGEFDTLEYVQEIKIEMICTDGALRNVLETLKHVHPYEEPAYGVIELKTLEDFLEKK